MEVRDGHEDFIRCLAPSSSILQLSVYYSNKLLRFILFKYGIKDFVNILTPLLPILLFPGI